MASKSWPLRAGGSGSLMLADSSFRAAARLFITCLLIIVTITIKKKKKKRNTVS
jgi:hypothetical protein